ncbi:hemolysin family protein [Pseudobacter ginsenosidimutans]|uniref:Putative hemolysin n=1 Tax=Pseudobacter ginsenosidimutans TaxID=661488 RepID=A0A4Q7MFV5_9BACT|nr:hemolysin family protein [Pseudobacter ginsenosidimutans]QEC45441.1 HlyC/CorC family transporter [Pseudobacter ginsenosidimutans]RZS66971.1 putative hemolysin [Pseudobacter ginsenosidimutans]
MGEIFIILGLILLNGLFSMAEIALVSARKARLEAQANKGDSRAKEALKLANHPDTFLSTVQIGITLIGILTGIFSGEKLKSGLVEFLQQYELTRIYASGLATAIIVVAVTYFSLVLGELLPKRIGLSRPETIAKTVAGPMRIISIATYPFIWLLTKSTYVLVKLFGIKAKDNQVTEEEIKAIISEGTEQGTIEEAEQEIIERVFHLGDRNITSIMTHRSDIIWFDAADNEQNIREKILREPHSVYPICEGSLDNLKGVVSLKDLYVTNDMTVFAAIMKPALFVPENITAYTVLEKFKKQKIHACFIVDEYGTLQGMITLNDILEAIVGDLPQMDIEDYEIREREDGSYLVDGQIPFYDFLTHFEKTEWMNEGEQEFDTLAGFILHKLERIPHTGDTLDWQGFRFEVVDMDAQRIDKLLVYISDEIKDNMDDEDDD